jgi:hypothetical protein
MEKETKQKMNNKTIEKKRAIWRAWARKYRSYPENRAKLSQKKKEDYQINKGYILKRNKKYRDKNKDIINKRQNKYYYENHEKMLASAQRSRDKIKKERSQKQYEYKKKRLKTDHIFKIKERIRGRIYLCLRKNKIIKSQTFIDLLGTHDMSIVWDYLEKQFKRGMTKQNHGKWHIDHIRPISSFDLNDIEQQKQCFNYKNLQPLWASENMSKGSKFE